MPDFNKNDFSGNPVRLDMSRSKFSMPFKHKTTFNAGMCVPIMSYGDVLPGDSFNVDLSSLVRMSTPVFPVMDDAYLDYYFFFTPHKLTLSRQMMSPSVNDSQRSWKAFIGAQDSLLNMPTPSDVLLPCVFLDCNGLTTELHSMADYFGLGLSDGDHVISCLEPLAYYAIWNSYFRDENTMQPIVYSLSSPITGNPNPAANGRATVKFSGFDGTSRWGTSQNSIGFANSILPACRPHGYFGSALPWPQRNLSMINISLGSLAPLVVGNDYDIGGTLRMGSFVASSGATARDLKLFRNAGDYSGDVKAVDATYPGSGVDVQNIRDINLWADLSQAGGVSINQLRLLVQTQRWYEALARGGNRIGEMTASMFGVTPSDLAQDRPEYLGGKRVPISMDQVTDTASNLGSLGAYSNTGDRTSFSTKSFDTWGTLTCIVVARTNESFHQGIPRRYSRKRRFDFYWPQFANLGEQPILNKEIYAVGSYNSTEDQVFGYQEAWAEYRYLPDIVSAELRPNKSLGAYTYANNFQQTPTLGAYLNAEGVIDNVDRTLKVASTTAGFQFIGDFYFNIVCTRPMPRYSIPGLVDHH